MVNFNTNIVPQPTSSTGMFSRFMSGGSLFSTTNMLIFGGIILFVVVAIIVYYTYISPSMKSKYKPNREQVPAGSNPSKTAELMLFYADWCPHCKAAKPIWNDLKAEYESKGVNGYKLIFTEVDCSEESAEVEKMMNQYSVEGYPTIKLIKDGQVIDYDAKITKETLDKFLNTVL